MIPARLKLYAIGAGALISAIAAVAIWFNARDERLRREGEHRAEVREVTERADSVLKVFTDSAKVKRERDSTERAALSAALESARRVAAASMAAADANRQRADSLTSELATATTPSDSISTLTAALIARGREAMNARASAEQERQRADIAEDAAARAIERLVLKEMEIADTWVPLVEDLRQKLEDAAGAQKPPGLFKRMAGIVRDGLAVIGAVAIIVVAATVAK